MEFSTDLDTTDFDAADLDNADVYSDYDDAGGIESGVMPTMPTMTIADPSASPLIPDALPAMPEMSAPELATPELATPDLQPTDPAQPADPAAPDEQIQPGPETIPADGAYGSPDAWTVNWFYQEYDGYCGPSSIAQVVSEYTGLDISDPQTLVDRALELGLFYDDDPSMGMTSADMEILMEDQGVPCHVEQSSMTDLQDKLTEGYGIIAMVDSSEIWYPEENEVEDDTPDHALVVAGVDAERGVVILSDPGNPDGNQFEVPIDVFEDAWRDSGYQMLVADAPDADLADAPAAPADPTLAALAPRPWGIMTL